VVDLKEEVTLVKLGQGQAGGTFLMTDIAIEIAEEHLVDGPEEPLDTAAALRLTSGVPNGRSPILGVEECEGLRSRKELRSTASRPICKTKSAPHMGHEFWWRTIIYSFASA